MKVRTLTPLEAVALNRFRIALHKDTRAAVPAGEYRDLDVLVRVRIPRLKVGENGTRTLQTPDLELFLAALYAEAPEAAGRALEAYKAFQADAEAAEAARDGGKYLAGQVKVATPTREIPTAGRVTGDPTIEVLEPAALIAEVREA